MVSLPQRPRDPLIERMRGSLVSIVILPRRGMFDAKLAAEVGAAVLLDKPVICVAHPDAVIPPRLLAIADSVVRTAQIDDVAAELIRQAIQRVIDRVSRKDGSK